MVDVETHGLDKNIFEIQPFTNIYQKGGDMKGIRYLWILGILFITFCCEGANKVIMKVEVSGNPKWTAVSAGENDFEVQLSKTDIKLLGEDVLKFHFKKLTEEHANKHVRVEEREVLNLFELGKVYLNIKVEKFNKTILCLFLSCDLKLMLCPFIFF